jgi:hypothetical protein
MPRRTGSALAAIGALLAALPAPARAEAWIELTAERNAVAMGETVDVEIRVEAETRPDEPTLEPAEAFEVVSRAQSRETSFSLGGGAGVRLRQVVVTRLALAPRREGTVRLTAVTGVKGVRRSSAPVEIRVLPAGAAPPAPSSPPGLASRGAPAFRGWEKDLALEVQLDRREAWLGEQVIASIWLFAPLGVAAYDRVDPPRWDGFWVEELETPRTLRYEVRKVNGIPTRAYLIQRVALFPTRAGDLRIPAAEVDVAVRLGGSPLDPFADVQRVRRRSAPLTLKVRPLPPGAPDGFRSVNVGRFALEVAAVPPRAVAGQAVAVRVTASGDGNVRALALPGLPGIAGARAFEPTTSEQVAPARGRVAGSRTVETMLVPARAGELLVPALAWPWFDPRKGRFEIARTAALRIPIDPGAPEAAPAPAPDPLEALRPIRADLDLAPAGRPAPWRGPLLALALLVPPAVFAGLVLRDRLRRRTPSAARREHAAARAAGRAIAAARRRLEAGDPAGALAAAERALLGYAADRLGLPVFGLTRAELLAALEAKGAHPPARHALAAALEASDAARFGGGGAAAPVLELAERAVAALGEAGWSEEARP